MTKNGVLTHVIVQKFISIKPASLTVSSSCTNSSIWKHEISRWMKRLATNAMHALHHEMILIISFEGIAYSRHLASRQQILDNQTIGYR